jgi:invasion protein IalB
MLRRSILALALLIVAVPATAADAPKRLGKTGAWEAYVYPEGGSKVCYMAAQADRAQGGDKGRVGTAIAITHRPRSPGEVSLIAGYGFKKDSEAEIQIGGMKHSFFTNGKSAWAKDSKADSSIIATMIKGRDVTIRAVPVKGGAVTDNVSLAGFSDALEAIDKACGVKR